MYLMIDDFAAGIDLRKSPETAPAGTLRALRNGFITPGGEIQKRKTFTGFGVLPAGTLGLGFLNNQLVVFGEPAAVVGLPQYVTYQQLPPPAGRTLAEILDVQNFIGKLYVVVLLDDGSQAHYYDGVQVADANAQGTSVLAAKSKLMAVDGPNLRFSAIRTATDWTTTANGAGVIDVTTEDGGTVDLVGLAKYYGYLAVFGRTETQIWSLDPDPAASNLEQVLGAAGLVAPRACIPWGNGDVLYLSDTGVRSLRARDTSVAAAAVNDVGAPIDALLAGKRLTLTPAEARAIQAMVDPLTGHFWLIWGQEIYVLAEYPRSKISAWSVFDAGRPVDAATIGNSRLAIRQGDELFIYGSSPGGNPFDPNTPLGSDEGATYDSTPVVVQTPLLDVSKPATTKLWKALDLSCTGVWDVEVNLTVTRDPDQENWIKVATVGGSTWTEGRIPLDLEGTHISVRLTSTNDGPASIASMALHHELGEES